MMNSAHLFDNGEAADLKCTSISYVLQMVLSSPQRLSEMTVVRSLKLRSMA